MARADFNSRVASSNFSVSKTQNFTEVKTKSMQTCLQRYIGQQKMSISKLQSHVVISIFFGVDEPGEIQQVPSQVEIVLGFVIRLFFVALFALILVPCLCGILKEIDSLFSLFCVATKRQNGPIFGGRRIFWKLLRLCSDGNVNAHLYLRLQPDFLLVPSREQSFGI
jgi:hypothetical protein